MILLEKLKKKLIDDDEKQKKEIEDKLRALRPIKEKGGQEIIKRSIEENIKEEAEGSICDISENVRGINPDSPKWKCRKFNGSFTVFLDEKIRSNCYIGRLQNESATLAKSFMEASSYHMDNLHKLVSLVRNHECLLNVEHFIEDPTDGSKFLVTEEVYSLEEFFHMEYIKFNSKSSDKASTSSHKASTWWDYISGMYWKIFRDVSRGLMFLYEKTEYVCGDLSFNSFVTFEGRGRILPTLDESKKGKEDVKQLINLMRSVLDIPSKGKSDPADTNDALLLPSDLKKLLNFIPRYLDLPPSFLVDLPFLWTNGEKIDFSPKFKKLVKKTNFHENGVEEGMLEKGAFNEWWEVLTGVYKEIAKANKMKITPYTRNVDIARFFNAAYSHVNDKSYKKDRGDKKFTEMEIERDLVSFFPDYYVTVFECLCMSVNKSALDVKDLKQLSSVYFRDDDQ